MPIGSDTQYDQPWSEIDKIKRRLDLRYRLKEEGMRKRYDPFLQLRAVRFSDPAVDRYADLRKRGRQPGTPLAPKIFYTMVAIIFIPLGITWWHSIRTRGPIVDKLRSGDIPYSERDFKSIG